MANPRSPVEMIMDSVTSKRNTPGPLHVNASGGDWSVFSGDRLVFHRQTPRESN